ncbi:MAG: DUF2442 domain-containing protein [Saprospiraceae bacterium]
MKSNNHIHTIQSISFEGDEMIIVVDDRSLKIKLSEVSGKLARANMEERNKYNISPSGYGIHWPGLDEDLSINGFLENRHY